MPRCEQCREVLLWLEPLASRICPVSLVGKLSWMVLRSFVNSRCLCSSFCQARVLMIGATFALASLRFLSLVLSVLPSWFRSPFRQRHGRYRVVVAPHSLRVCCSISGIKSAACLDATTIDSNVKGIFYFSPSWSGRSVRRLA